MSAWTAMPPVFGVVVGAVLQHWFARTAETNEQVGLLRSAAYVDYLRAIARLAHSPTSEAGAPHWLKPRTPKRALRYTEARSAVGALARFEEALKLVLFGSTVAPSDNAHSR